MTAITDAAPDVARPMWRRVELLDAWPGKAHEQDHAAEQTTV